jgi:hypothetical protein
MMCVDVCACVCRYVCVCIDVCVCVKGVDGGEPTNGGLELAV